MPIERINFDDVTETDLQELLDGEVQEGIRIEYKRDAYGRSDKDKREAMKDVSAFLNLHGGHLIIGIEEAERIAKTILGLSSAEAEKEIEWLTNLINTGIEPRINVPIRSIPLKNGNYVVVLRIPASWNPPHRVKTGGWNKFWIRNSNGVHEASMQELRDLFTLSSGFLERVRNFRESRIEIIESRVGRNPFVTSHGQLFLHIVPFSAFSSINYVNLEKAFELSTEFMPIGTTDRSPGYNFEGFINKGFINNRISREHLGYTQIFREGILEATKGYIFQTHPDTKKKVIPGRVFEKQILNAISRYINGLKQLDVLPPLVVAITIRGVQGVNYKLGEYDENIIDRPILDLPECILEEYGAYEDYDKKVKPAFDALWNAAGFPEAKSFDENGVWNPKFSID